MKAYQRFLVMLAVLLTVIHNTSSVNGDPVPANDLCGGLKFGVDAAVYTCETGYYCHRWNDWWWECEKEEGSSLPLSPAVAPAAGTVMGANDLCGGLKFGVDAAVYSCETGYYCQRWNDWWWECEEEKGLLPPSTTTPPGLLPPSTTTPTPASPTPQPSEPVPEVLPPSTTTPTPASPTPQPSEPVPEVFPPSTTTTTPASPTPQPSGGTPLPGNSLCGGLKFGVDAAVYSCETGYYCHRWNDWWWECEEEELVIQEAPPVLPSPRPAPKAPPVQRPSPSPLTPSPLTEAVDLTKEFIKREGELLTLGGKPFYFVGFNAYWMFDRTHFPGRSIVDKFFQACQDHHLVVGRMWGVGHNLPSWPGFYNEEDFQHIDYVIAAARRYGIRLQISMGNFWAAYKSPEDWLRYAGLPGGDLITFYRDSRVLEVYKQHVRALLTRRNVYTGLTYRDDPTIMGWDVMNEPRCPGCNNAEGDIFHHWIEEVAVYIKALAPKQLVMLGTEGFFGVDNPRTNTGYNQYNPGAGTQCEGEDWVRGHEMEAVDLATMHIYERQVEGLPPNGYECAKDFTCVMNWAKAYLQAHVDAAGQTFKKPLIVQETGVILNMFSMRERKAYMKWMLEDLVERRNSGSPLMGVMFWSVSLCEVYFPYDYDIYLDTCGRGRSSRKLTDAESTAHPDMEAAVAKEDVIHDGRGLLQTQENMAFRREGPRGICAVQSWRTWRPLFPLSGSIDVDQLLRSGDAYTDAGIIRELGEQINTFPAGSLSIRT